MLVVETWDSAKCVTHSTDYYQRITLESWFTKLEQTPLNRYYNYVHLTNDLLTTTARQTNSSQVH